jgi:hypothetical protein
VDLRVKADFPALVGAPMAPHRLALLGGWSAAASPCAVLRLWALAWSSLRSSRKAFGLRPLAWHALALLGLWARRRVCAFDRNGAVRG